MAMYSSLIVALVFIWTAHPFVQSPPKGPTFDEVSIKRNTSGALDSGIEVRPDGGLVIRNLPIAVVIARAYGPLVPADIMEPPEWATKNRYDIVASSSLPQASESERAAMLKAMLAERFALAAHIEPRREEVFDLVLARQDGRLGAKMTRTDTDCAAIQAERAAHPSARRPFDPNAPIPPCMLMMVMTRLEGDTTMENLASFLRLSGRRVVDKTGLTDFYHVLTTFNPRLGMPVAAGAAADDLPSVFTALKEDLGLELRPSHADVPKLIIDHLSLPTEN